MNFPSLQSRAILAPMAGINDVAFRLLCKEYGCGLTYTEMLSAPAIARRNKATLEKIDCTPAEAPFGIQLFGQSAEHVLDSALYLEETAKPSVIDLNLGCPARQIVRQGAGCALLVRKSRVEEIVKACSSRLQTPFTVKIRSGQMPGRIVALDIAKAAEGAGAAAIAVHPRTMSQGYSGKADWDIIRQVKQAVSIPVIGNGDIFSAQDAARMMEATGCDYVMVGRAAMKSPIIFQQINDYLRKRHYKPAESKDRLKMVKRYLFLAREHHVSYFNIKLHCQHFTAGMPGGARLRDSISKSKDESELLSILGS